jgi:hypothetical protein
MIASHRTPATALMTAGGMLLLIAAGIPFFLQGNIPEGFKTAALLMKCLGLPLYVGGACVYARGIGYPALLGLVAITIIGLLVLMLLPDRHSDQEDLS